MTYHAELVSLLVNSIPVSGRGKGAKYAPVMTRRQRDAIVEALIRDEKRVSRVAMAGLRDAMHRPGRLAPVDMIDYGPMSFGQAYGPPGDE